ncbi:hypothetical protein Mgra_00003507 [Meloidogyne graminicola]|uniref:Uncharacterized protein n=1 Tax=Meloidogyne graminicola TaxID=189291 RepID=A0A8S9ZU66_9BILA|nr:hypothetical protein Mgra_00003507 [Meloidogyne graminicola]
MYFGKIINYIQKLIVLILIIKLCNASPWSSSYNSYGVNDGRSNIWSRFPPSMLQYGQFGRSPYGSGDVQGLGNPFYSSNIRPMSSYSPYNNYFPLYGGQQQNRYGLPLSSPFNGYRTFGGPYT